MFLFNKESNFNLANLFTFVNISAGVLAIYFILEKNFFYAVVVAWIGGFFDIFDGKIARKFNLSSEFGLQLDSFADSLSFVIVPTLLIYVAIFKDNEHISKILLVVVFIFYEKQGYIDNSINNQNRLDKEHDSSGSHKFIDHGNNKPYTIYIENDSFYIMEL